ncbi:MAG: Acetyltransferase domain, partial [Planctomycetota bacterium]
MDGRPIKDPGQETMASTKDLEALRRLWTSTFAVPAGLLERWLRDPRRVLVERDAGEVVGACALSALRLVDARREWRVVWLRALAVRPESRGRGHGGRLVARALDLARAHGCALALRSRRRGLYDRAGLRIAGSVLGAEVASPVAAELACGPWSARLADARSLARATALAT